jgi:anti-sigma factor RsiW
MQDKQLEEFNVVQRSLEGNPALKDQYDAWTTRRGDFNKRLRNRDPETVREAWQRYYFRGELPEETGPAPAEHVNKRRLKSPRLGL